VSDGGHSAQATAPAEAVAADEEFELRLPPALDRWWTGVRERWTRVDTVALVVTWLQVPVLLWLLVPGSFYIDDFRGMAKATREPFWQYLVDSKGSHFSPGSHLVDVLQNTFAPLEHAPAVAVSIGLRVALAWAFWRLLRELFGRRPAALVPLALLAFSPALVPVTGWFRQSITVLPAMIAIALTTHAHVRYLHDRRLRHALVGALWLALGLCFYEKPVAVLPFLVAFSVLFFSVPRSGLRGAWTALRQALPALACYAAVAAVWLGVYAAGSYDRGGSRPVGVSSVGTLARLSLVESDIPSALGGPWRWDWSTQFYGIASTPPVLVGACVLALAVFLFLAARADLGRTTRAVVLFLVYYGTVLAIITAGRLSKVGGTQIGRDYRLWADVVPVLLLAAALAVLPLRTGPRAVAGVRPRHRNDTTLVTVLAGALALVLAAGAAVSTVQWGREWHRNPSGAFVANVVHDVRAAHGRALVVPTSLPPTVLPWWVEPDFTVEDLVAPLKLPAQFTVLDGVPTAVRSDGHLVPVTEQVVTSSPAQPGFCAYPVPAASTGRVVPFTRGVPYYGDGAVRVGLLVPSRTTVTLAMTYAGTTTPLVTRRPIVLDRGPHTVLVRIPWPDRTGPLLSGVLVTSTGPSVSLCVTSAQVVVTPPRP
jgi:hypothetical protein